VTRGPAARRRQIKATAPEIVVTTEVCGCSWTDHGECAILDGRGRIVSAATFELMGRMAVLHALAGADVVSPTAMLAGSVRAVRDVLTDSGLPDVGGVPEHRGAHGVVRPVQTDHGHQPGRRHRRGLQLEPGRADRDTLTLRATVMAWASGVVLGVRV